MSIRCLALLVLWVAVGLTAACDGEGGSGVAGAGQDGADDAAAGDTAEVGNPAPDSADEGPVDAARDESVDAPESDSTADGMTDGTTNSGTDAAEADVASADASDDAPECGACSALRPVILVHGINGAPENFDVMAARLEADGWPANYIVRFAAADPSWGCNVDNAAALAELVEQVRAATCQPRVDIVAHSMGTLSSRYYIKFLGGQDVVNTYVTLGGMHHGLFTPCLAPDFLGVCVWQELCESGDFIAELNAEPATPGELHWVSIYGTADADVPNASSIVEGAENIAIEGAEHAGENGLEQREDVYAEVRRVLGYDCW